ncbi:hypothetical protein HK102_007601, partial [Quaeritorhiza haematococci]
MFTRLTKRLIHLDAFPKLEKNYQVATGSGGFLTLFVSAILAYLVFSELSQFLRINQTFEFLVDQSPLKGAGAHGLLINVDVTVGMPCQYLRADVLDASGESLPVRDQLVATPTIFETRGAKQFRSLKPSPKDDLNVKKILREAQGRGDYLKRPTINSGSKPDAQEACQIKGTVSVNKVSGMLHITALGHGYMGQHTPHEVMNFTHRIDKLSFGVYYHGLVNPLDNSAEIADEPFAMFQYFINV